MKGNRRIIIFFLLFLIFPCLIHALDNPSTFITVKKGDTLIGLCRKLLEHPGQWQTIARINHMNNPDRIFPENIIRFPIQLLRGYKTYATVTFAKGDVTFRTKQNEGWKSLAAGSQITEGTSLRTGQGSGLEIAFQDGHSILQRENTSVKVVAARRVGGFSRYRVSQSMGRVVSTIKKSTGKEVLFQIETPSAIAGVRGTAFRSSVDPGGVSRFEALEDSVKVEARNQAVQIREGEGTLVYKGKAPVSSITLLPFPAPVSPAVLYTKPLVQIAFKQVEDAVSYRILLARDKGIRDLVMDKVIAPQDTFRIISVEDGTYYLQSASIDRQGLEGLPSAPAEIHIRFNPVAPFIEIPQDKAGYFDNFLLCKWFKVSDAVRYHVQIAEDKEFLRVVRDRSDITDNEYTTGELGFKTYFFRVSSIASDNYQGEWSDPLTFTLKLPPPTPPPAVEMPNMKAKEIVIRWQDLGKDISYRFQMSGETSFKGPLADSKTAVPEITVPRPKQAGTYYVRTSTVDRWGQEGKFSSPQSFEIKKPQPPAVKTIEQTKDNVLVRWENLGKDMSYHVQCSSQKDFGKLFSDLNTDQAGITFARPKQSGIYYVRVSGVDSGGCEGSFSKPQKFKISNSMWPGLAGAAAYLIFLLAR